MTNNKNAGYKVNFTNEGGVEGTTRFLKNICGMWLLERCRKEWTTDYSYPELIEAAMAAPAFRSLINPDAPDFYAGGNMVQKIKDFCAKTNQPVPETVGAVARCAYESLALKYRNALEGLEAMKGQRIDSLNIVGGAINNKFLDQLIADALDREVVTGPVEGAAIGNLLTQAMALGDIKDLDALRQVVRNSESVETWTPNHTAAWDEAYETLLKLL